MNLHTSLIVNVPTKVDLDPKWCLDWNGAVWRAGCLFCSLALAVSLYGDMDLICGMTGNEYIFETMLS